MNDVKFIFDGNYLVAEIENASAVINYQLEMLTHAEINNLLPTKKQIKNNMVYLYYENVGRMSLNRALMRTKMSDNEYLLFIKSALNVAKEMEEYQLTPDGIVMDENYIFINPVDYIPKFVYLPIYKTDSGVNNIVAFLKNMLVSDMVEIRNSNIMQQIISILNSGGDVNYMINEFDKVGTVGGGIREIRQKPDNGVVPPPPVNSVKPPVQPVQPVQPVKPSVQPVQPVQPVQSGKPPVQTVPPIPPIKPGGPANGGGKKKPPQSGGVPNTNNISAVPQPDMGKILPIMVGVAVVGVLIFAALISAGVIESLDISIVVGGAIFIAAAEYFVYSNLKTKYLTNKTVSQPANVKPNIKTGKEMKIPPQATGNVSPIKPMPPLGNDTPIKPVTPPNIPKKEVVIPEVKPIEPVPVNITPNIPSTPVDNNTWSMGFNDSGKTEIIMDENIKISPYLQGRTGQKIIIQKSIVRIGKLSEQVDFVIQNPRVSRVHADIIYNEGKLYVMDLGSANGTYINGSSERITANMEYELHNNDRVVFANEEFTVYC